MRNLKRFFTLSYVEKIKFSPRENKLSESLNFSSRERTKDMYNSRHEKKGKV